MPPVGPAAPFPEATAAWTSVTRECRDVRTYQAQLAVSGRIGTQRVPGLTVGLALDATGNIGMEVRVGGPPLVNLAGPAAQATLVLHDDRRVVTAPAEQLVEALVGVPLGPRRLLALLTGCVSTDLQPAAAELVDGMARIRTSDATVYLSQAEGAWRLRGGEFDGLVADYRMVNARPLWPARIEVRSLPDRSPRVALTLRVVEFDVDNPRFDPAVFRVNVPDAAVVTSIEALRDSGPLGGSRGR